MTSDLIRRYLVPALVAAALLLAALASREGAAQVLPTETQADTSMVTIIL